MASCNSSLWVVGMANVLVGSSCGSTLVTAMSRGSDDTIASGATSLVRGSNKISGLFGSVIDNVVGAGSLWMRYSILLSGREACRRPTFAEVPWIQRYIPWISIDKAHKGFHSEPRRIVLCAFCTANTFALGAVDECELPGRVSGGGLVSRFRLRDMYLRYLNFDCPA